MRMPAAPDGGPTTELLLLPAAPAWSDGPCASRQCCGYVVSGLVVLLESWLQQPHLRDLFLPPTAMIFLPLLRPCIMMELVSLRNEKVTIHTSAAARWVHAAAAKNTAVHHAGHVC